MLLTTAATASASNGTKEQFVEKPDQIDWFVVLNLDGSYEVYNDGSTCLTIFEYCPDGGFDYSVHC